ncbi:uncharacterized protein RHIMIDRAFT_278643 [Rhizopus microsporus ATCC 52813]|uniref:Uncharacterized protein n=1 Tax=Rhizopus microsporus ATCC 52813 TaxID=1340429 RepID=A0A2G4SZR4_RHIZD|nr:uncharacterized protein RHIMIDRAFT_278643 [Rhizopus microsporus ATCC 52813]PHZ14259.1 hypothetical protein RHIMIDRAFT_278643 [Rhizopus microsporus ATCC 52813]
MNKIPSIDQLLSSLQDHLTLKDANMILNTANYYPYCTVNKKKQDFVLYNDVQNKTRRNLKLLPDLKR